MFFWKDSHKIIMNQIYSAAPVATLEDVLPGSRVTPLKAGAGSSNLQHRRPEAISARAREGYCSTSLYRSRFACCTWVENLAAIHTFPWVLARTAAILHGICGGLGKKRRLLIPFPLAVAWGLTGFHIHKTNSGYGSTNEVWPDVL